LKSVLKYLFSTALAAGLLYWAFSSSHLSWEDLLKTFQNADYNWVAVSLLFSVIAHYLRAVRWGQLLAVMNYKPGNTRTLSAVLIGYFANFLIPRMGEVTRCGSLQKTASIPFEKSFGTVITERIIDLICLGLALLINIYFELEPLKNYLFPNLHLPGNTLLVTGIASAVFVFGLFYVFRTQISETYNKIIQSSKLGAIIAGWVDGIKSVFLVKNPILFIIYSLGIWICYYLNAYVLLLAFPESANLGLGAAITILVMGSFGMAMPTQGGIGAYHSLVGSTLIYYGIAQSNSAALATFFHGTQMVSILLLGGISFIITLFLPKIDSLEKLQ